MKVYHFEVRDGTKAKFDKTTILSAPKKYN